MRGLGRADAAGGQFGSRRWAAGWLTGRHQTIVPAGVGGADADELTALALSLLDEQHDLVGGRLVAAMERLGTRGVPLRRVRSDAGIRGQCVLEFGDGTALVVRPFARRDDLGAVAVASLRHRVLVSGWQDDPPSYRLGLAWQGGGRTLLAVGVAGEALS